MGRGRGAYWPRVVVWRHLLAGAALVAPLHRAVRGHLGLAPLLIGCDLTVEGEGGALGLPGVRREAMGWCSRGGVDRRGVFDYPRQGVHFTCIKHV